MYHKNQIILLFIEHLENKSVFKVSPEFKGGPNKKVTIVYKDNSTSEFQTTLSHNEFAMAWREFCDWSRNIHQTQTDYIQDWTD